MDHLQVVGLEDLLRVRIASNAVDKFYWCSVAILRKERYSILTRLYRMQDLRHRLIHEHRILDLVHRFLATLLEQPLNQLSIVHLSQPCHLIELYINKH